MLALPQVGQVQAVREIEGERLEIETEQVISTGLFTQRLCRHTLVAPEDLTLLQVFSYRPKPVSSAGMDCTRTPPRR